jgi:transcriptional regulator with XRE-family HTH domain
MKREMLIGDKNRNIRTLKGLSQENMAVMLNLSSVLKEQGLSMNQISIQSGRSGLWNNL